MQRNNENELNEDETVVMGETTQMQISNSEQIDRLVSTLEGMGDDEDPLLDLTGSLHSTYLDFGVFDSMTLVRCKRRNEGESTQEELNSNSEECVEILPQPQPQHRSPYRRSGIRRGQNNDSEDSDDAKSKKENAALSATALPSTDTPSFAPKQSHPRAA